MATPSKKSTHPSGSGTQTGVVQRRYVAAQLCKQLTGIVISKTGMVVLPKAIMTMLRPWAIIEPKGGGVRVGQHAHLGLELED